MLTNEEFEKIMQDIRARIDQLDQQMRQRAENRLQAIYDDYHKTLLDRISNELALADAAHIRNDDNAMNRHLQLANIFKSILENHIQYGPINK